MLVRGIVEEETNCTGRISEIYCDTSVTFQGVKQLLSLPRQLIDKYSLHWNTLGSGSCATFHHLFPHVPHLKELDLYINPECCSGSAMLTKSNSLSLTINAISQEDCHTLSELLSSSTSLKRLFLRGSNALAPEAVELIIGGLASMLRTNQTLVTLTLQQCNIDSDGASRLARALCTNSTLQELNLEGNSIEIGGVFAKLLSKNKSLKLKLH